MKEFLHNLPLSAAEDLPHIRQSRLSMHDHKSGSNACCLLLLKETFSFERECRLPKANLHQRKKIETPQPVWPHFNSASQSTNSSSFFSLCDCAFVSARNYNSELFNSCHQHNRGGSECRKFWKDALKTIVSVLL